MILSMGANGPIVLVIFFGKTNLEFGSLNGNGPSNKECVQLQPIDELSDVDASNSSISDSKKDNSFVLEINTKDKNFDTQNDSDDLDDLDDNEANEANDLEKLEEFKMSTVNLNNEMNPKFERDYV